jgi:hypothetical protein
VCCWLYPLIEINWAHSSANFDPNLPGGKGFFNFGNFQASGTIVTMAVGANAVLIPEKLEFGAVYTRPLHTERGLEFNGLLVKMLYRF